MKLRTLALGSIASAALFATGALAADLPVRSAAPAPIYVAPIFTWTGFYVGLNAGYAWGDSSVRVAPGGNWVGDPDWLAVSAAATHKLDMDSFTGGVQIGYNWQAGSVVFGIEADMNYLGAKESVANGPFNGVFAGTFSTYTSVSSNWLATIRPRLGVAFDRALIYVTGGLAIADRKFTQNISYVNFTTIPGLPITGAGGAANGGSDSGTDVGWTLGVGLEWAFSNNWSMKAEYLYVDLGDRSFTSASTVAGNWAISHTERSNHLNIIRAGLNYRFGGSTSPVIARY